MKLLILLLLVACNSGGGASSSLAPTNAEPFIEESDSIGFVHTNTPADHPKIAFNGECFEDEPNYCDIEGVIWLDPFGIVEIHQMEFTARLELVNGEYVGQTSAAGCTSLDIVLAEDMSRIDIGGNAGTSQYAWTAGTQITDYTAHIPNVQADCVTYGNY